MSYVPPHKRGQAPIELKDFPSLEGAGGGRAAGAGTGEKYSSKAAIPATISRLNIEKKEPATFIGSRFQRTTTEYKVEPEKAIDPPVKDDGWTTVESKPLKKFYPKEEEKEWDGFEY